MAYLKKWSSVLFIKHELNLLHNQLSELSKTPSYHRKFDSYLCDLIAVIEDILDKYESIPDDASFKISRQIWMATKYLMGCATSSYPYEVAHILKNALQQWYTNPFLITTALIDEPNFHFNNVDPKEIIVHFFPGIKINEELIQIALPKLYRHKPLYSIPLYHELGHFVDDKYGISKYSILIDLLANKIKPGVVEIEFNHRKEFFADIFASSYIGDANSLFLSKFIPDQPPSLTHPATKDRKSVASDFLDGRGNVVLDRIFDSLKALSLPDLKAKFVIPSIEPYFDNIRPYEIKTEEELHGIMVAGWHYLDKIQANPYGPWEGEGIDIYKMEKVVDDLVEKSIRNWMIKKKWDDGTGS